MSLGSHPDRRAARGYGTAIFGKWHLGSDPQSLPTTHGFDEFYGIPPNLTWDSATYVDTITLTHSIEAPRAALVEKGPHIVEGTLGNPRHDVKPFTLEVRAEIDLAPVKLAAIRIWFRFMSR